VLTVEHTPAVSAIHPAKALVCVGRVLYGVPLLRRQDVVAEAETPERLAADGALADNLAKLTNRDV
jgi:hypothetical protein